MESLRKKEKKKTKKKTQVLEIKGIPGGPVIKTLPANAGDSRDESSIPGLGRSPGIRKNTATEMKNKYLLTTHK